MCLAWEITEHRGARVHCLLSSESTGGAGRSYIATARVLCWTRAGDKSSGLLMAACGLRRIAAGLAGSRGLQEQPWLPRGQPCSGTSGSDGLLHRLRVGGLGFRKLSIALVAWRASPAATCSIQTGFPG